jgi:transcription-repair coupling factor (superfamily II helicase)
MLTMQAYRDSNNGFIFPADSSWQKDLEDSFLYQETPDQMKAIEDMKEDMESKRSMDRLICGDVGFGKTEVAIRGAFKAVQSAKQVLVLVPTTVLAQQHYQTFSERMAEFAIVVDVISRFRTMLEQRHILSSLLEGKVDILIGTHRI